MNRSDFLALILTATFGTLMLFANALANPDDSNLASKLNQDGNKLMEASYQLVHHSKSIVVESLTLTRESVTLVLDIAINAL